MNTRALHVVVCAAAVLAAGSIADAAVRIVRTGATYSTVKAAYDAAISGDTLEIESGTYTGSEGWVVIYKNNLTLRGVGPTRPVLDANGGATANKGILVVYAANLTVENLELANAYIPASVGLNAAGIRYQPGSSPALLTVRNCYFHHNQNGILGGEGSGTDIVLENCEFYRNGAGDGYSHNMYISTARSFTLKNCYVHDALYGHEVKTRAATNYILYNRISNETGSAARELQLANGGTAYVIGNVIVQGNGGNSQIITYGDEGSHPNPYLYIINNTIVNRRWNGAQFIYNAKSNSTALYQNNIFQLLRGNETIISGPGTQVSNLVTYDAGFVDMNGYDFRLTAASTGAINMGTAPGFGYNSVDLTPVEQYVHPYSQEARPGDGVIDIGAYEYINPNQDPTVDAGADLSVREGQRVDLHAVASDPDMDPLTWFWGQVSGAAVSLADETTDAPWFIAPTVTSVQQAEMAFMVAVDDGKGGQATDTVAVRVYMTGDINRDDSVNVIDLLMLAGAWNTTQNDPSYDPHCDLNDDGAVNVMDLLLLANNWTRALN